MGCIIPYLFWSLTYIHVIAIYELFLCDIQKGKKKKKIATL